MAAESLKWLHQEIDNFIFIAEQDYRSWSGSIEKSLYKENRIIFNPDVVQNTDYGKAHAIIELFGIVALEHGEALVFGGELLPVTFLYSTDEVPVFARWWCGESEEEVNQCLFRLHTAEIQEWKKSLSFSIRSDKQLLFESIFSGIELDAQQEPNMLQTQLPKGVYEVWTSNWEPNEDTSLILHKFVFVSALE